MANDDMIRDAAARWAVLTGEPGFDDWEGFMQWLEADPAHGRAYDAVNLAVAEAAELAVAAPANDGWIHAEPPAARPTRRAWLGSAIAASLALVGGVWFWQTHSREIYSLETAPGQMRTVELETGTRIDLAGGTVVRLDRKDPRYAVLDKGQALFTVRHDAARPFHVEAGEATLVDLGTVFDVAREGTRLSVGVAEGAVGYNPKAENLRLAPGDRLIADAGSVNVGHVPPREVGEWREGRLTFDAAPLSEVAARLSRATGIAFAAQPGSDAPVSGSILVTPIHDDPQMIGALLGLQVRHEGQVWTIGKP
ncbi:FecR family protein [Novosphingobium sp. PhB165]|uniref:FecR family protein n=1 Tax=Novosphingobium sp. PhB165 TaxID=2485105 RepID=UPI00104C6F69|nr:FecR domain-containing protein [Novosphingobium sp. PhB165]TCM21681.1 FecR family protein [Novosphingobium sp. PhB165]